MLKKSLGLRNDVGRKGAHRLSCVTSQREPQDQRPAPASLGRRPHAGSRGAGVRAPSEKRDHGALGPHAELP